jgi:hypothetical protein
LYPGAECDDSQEKAAAHPEPEGLVAVTAAGAAVFFGLSVAVRRAGTLRRAVAMVVGDVGFGSTDGKAAGPIMALG